MFRHVVVAGTFDRLHAGHKAMLSRAFTEGERVTIGLTTDEYVRNYKSKAQNPKSQINPKLKIQNRLEIRNLKLEIRRYIERKKHLEQWLKKNDYEQRARIIPLDDPYGPVIPQSPHDPGDTDIEAIVVSTETRLRAEEINQLRRAAGWKPLAVIEVPMVPAEDLVTISSTRVRKREIDRDGLPASGFAARRWQAGRLIMPDNLRPELQRPLGNVLVGSEIERSIKRNKGSILIAVGDVATKTLLVNGVVPLLAIIDGKVGRKPYREVIDRLQSQKTSRAVRVKSGPGYISGEATRAIKKALTIPLKVSIVIMVDGEEDLLALPAIASAPSGSVVYYGQPRTASVRGKPLVVTEKEGLVEVVVTKRMKQRALALLTRFLS